MVAYVATALTVYGIETNLYVGIGTDTFPSIVATALTVYGIETQRYRYVKM